MPDWDLLLTDARLATLRNGARDYGVIEDAAIGIQDGVLSWLGPRAALPAVRAKETRSLANRWVTPALIDCHTHLVFAGDRAGEFEQRLRGASYADIARAGGGIMATVRATRAATADELFASALARARALLADGVATLEIKSGYGLELESEMKSLEVARRIATVTGQTIRTTLLAAHAVPPEFSGDADRYIELICEQWLPAIAARRLADAVDAYCETIAFSSAQIATLFARARQLGLPVKLHADQLSDGNGAALAAEFSALSADHLEYTSATGVQAMRAAGTTAVLLPGAYVSLQETQLPPIAALRKAGVPMAVATDCNPGTSPLLSLRTAMALASRVFGLTAEESLAAATRNAARALGLADRGTLEPGKRADLAIWNIDHPRELSYWLGADPLASLLIAGQDASLRRS
ncbi:MAG: imidazolonepropionase [Gammaproteobacteria bacterium]|nr:imidazolonepropionase [Gammaproteobacteria bacterium]MDH5304774.1 imidazolonepropionase [Gammaproteobacteria bacterium]MDH5322407.1 imidazolonepropionase [Gammaproteobacteria bacterium]